MDKDSVSRVSRARYELLLPHVYSCMAEVGGKRFSYPAINDRARLINDLSASRLV